MYCPIVFRFNAGNWVKKLKESWTATLLCFRISARTTTDQFLCAVLVPPTTSFQALIKSGNVCSTNFIQLRVRAMACTVCGPQTSSPRNIDRAEKKKEEIWGQKQTSRDHYFCKDVKSFFPVSTRPIMRNCN